LQFLRDTLDFVHDAEQVAAPEFFDLLFGITVADKLQSHVEGFAGVVPADDAAAAVEIGRNADVVDANELHGLIDVIDEVFDRGGRIARVLLVDLGVFLVVLCAVIG
jgi:hypothetical protein